MIGYVEILFAAAEYGSKDCEHYPSEDTLIEMQSALIDNCFQPMFEEMIDAARCLYQGDTFDRMRAAHRFIEEEKNKLLQF